jgi:hypothetical protein
MFGFPSLWVITITTLVSETMPKFTARDSLEDTMKDTGLEVAERDNRLSEDRIIGQISFAREIGTSVD